MKNKKKNPYQFEVKTVKLSECSPDDIRVKLAEKVKRDYHMGEAQ